MDQSFEPSAIALLLLFVARLVIPLALTLLLAWGLHRLDRYWQAHPSRLQPAPGVPPVREGLSAATQKPGVVDRPCWEYRACSEAKRKKCPAGCGTDVVCWLARLRNDGRLPAVCRTCPIFTTTTPLRTAPGGAD
jgi:hypothetical protein